MTHIDPNWEKALAEPTDTFTLVTYGKEARTALLKLGEEIGMADEAQEKSREANKIPNPEALLQFLIQSIRDLKRDYIRSS